MPEISDPPDFTLTRSQKNNVFEWLQRARLDPSTFEWKEYQCSERTPRGDVHSTVSKLIHKGTGYYFVFGRVYNTFVPGHRAKIDVEEHLSDWGMQAATFNLWLLRLRREVDAPDLWSSIGQEKLLSTAASSGDLDNQPFSEDQLRLIVERLDEIKAYLLEGQGFNEAQAEYIDSEFEYLRESSRRFGRKDWLRLLLSVLISQAINLALAPEKAKGLLHLAGAAFQWVWGTAHGLLQ